MVLGRVGGQLCGSVCSSRPGPVGLRLSWFQLQVGRRGQHCLPHGLKQWPNASPHSHRCVGLMNSPIPGSPRSPSGQTARSWPPQAGTTASACSTGGRCSRWPCWPSTAPPSSAWPSPPMACWPRAPRISGSASGRSTHARDSPTPLPGDKEGGQGGGHRAPALT